MIPAEGCKVHETQSSVFWIDHQNFLCVKIKNAPDLPLGKRREAFELLERTLGQKKLPALIDLSEACSISREIRAYYSMVYPHLITALAFIAPSPLTGMLAGLYTGIKTPPFPCRTFSNEQDARLWLATML